MSQIVRIGFDCPNLNQNAHIPAASWLNIVMFNRILLLALCLAPATPAALVRVELSERSDVLAGKSFGSTGPYERLVGKAFFAVDPKAPRQPDRLRYR